VRTAGSPRVMLAYSVLVDGRPDTLDKYLLGGHFYYSVLYHDSIDSCKWFQGNNVPVNGTVSGAVSAPLIISVTMAGNFWAATGFTRHILRCHSNPPSRFCSYSDAADSLSETTRRINRLVVLYSGSSWCIDATLALRRPYG
jgi:hypothetical protein